MSHNVHPVVTSGQFTLGVEAVVHLPLLGFAQLFLFLLGFGCGLRLVGKSWGFFTGSLVYTEQKKKVIDSSGFIEIGLSQCFESFHKDVPSLQYWEP